jgi:hypothetical protein
MSYNPIMCRKSLLATVLVSCLAPGTWLSMFFPDPCAPPRIAAPPGTVIVLCAADECAEAREEIARKCADNRLSAGQRVPLFLLGGGHCLCPCP